MGASEKKRGAVVEDGRAPAARIYAHLPQRVVWRTRASTLEEPAYLVMDPSIWCDLQHSVWDEEGHNCSAVSFSCLSLWTNLLWYICNACLPYGGQWFFIAMPDNFLMIVVTHCHQQHMQTPVTYAKVQHSLAPWHYCKHTGSSTFLYIDVSLKQESVKGK